MPSYRFVCPHCWRDQTTTTRDAPDCHGPMRRDWRFNVATPMAAHFNATTGTYVSNETAFRDDLKRLSERQSAQTGMEHRYEPIDPSDRKTLGVTDEGLDATRRQARDSGQETATKTIIV